MEGIIHFLRRELRKQGQSGPGHDFEGFFDFVTQQRVPDTDLMEARRGLEGSLLIRCFEVMFRGYYHSFWHDDPTEASMRERYERRQARLWELQGSDRVKLFVRSNVSHTEVLQVPELMSELRRHFGAVRLLLVLEPHGEEQRRAIILVIVIYIYITNYNNIGKYVIILAKKMSKEVLGAEESAEDPGSRNGG